MILRGRGPILSLKVKSVKIKCKVDDIIKIIMYQDSRNKYIEKVGMGPQKMELIDQALKNGDWKVCTVDSSGYR